MDAAAVFYIRQKTSPIEEICDSAYVEAYEKYRLCPDGD